MPTCVGRYAAKSKGGMAMARAAMLLAESGHSCQPIIHPTGGHKMGFTEPGVTRRSTPYLTTNACACTHVPPTPPLWTDGRAPPTSIPCACACTCTCTCPSSPALLLHGVRSHTHHIPSGP